MYNALLVLHSIDRWVIIVLALVVIFRAIAVRPAAGAGPGRKDRWELFLMIAADVQLLIGVLLYFVTPWVATFLEAPGAAMGNAVTRFWTVEHGFGMIIAIALIHGGRIAARRAATERSRRRRIAIWIGIALLIILVTTPWPFMDYGRPLLRF
jgi:succinate dehydrogenase hydrophobic anchor subunit